MEAVKPIETVEPTPKVEVKEEVKEIKEEVKETGGNGNGKGKEEEFDILKVDGVDKKIPKGTVKLLAENLGIDESKARMYLQKEFAGDKRLNEVAEKEGKISALLNDLKLKPLEFMEKAGIDWMSEAQKKMYERMQYESLGDIEKRAYDAESKLKLESEKTKKYEDDLKNIEYQKTVEQAKQYYIERFDNVLKISGLENNEYIADRVKSYFQQELEENVQVTDDDIALLIKDDMEKQRASAITSVKDTKKLVDILGKDKVEEIRKYLIDSSKPENKAPKDQFSPSFKNKKNKRMTMKEFDEYLETVKGS